MMFRLFGLLLVGLVLLPNYFSDEAYGYGSVYDGVACEPEVAQ